MKVVKIVWMILLMTACELLLPARPVTPPESAVTITLRVPEDAYTISEAIAAGATVIEVGVGEFDLGVLPLAELPYKIHGSGIDRTKLRTGDSTPYTGEKGSSLSFSDLTLEKLGPMFMSFADGALDLRHVRLIGELRTSGAEVHIEDSNVKGAINVTDGSLDIVRSKISAGPSVPSAVEASANLHMTVEVNIRDTVLEATRVGFRIRVFLGTVNASLERVAVASSKFGASLVCMAHGAYNVTLDHSVFYKNQSAAVQAYGAGSEGDRQCGKLTIRNSMFVENRGIAVELHGGRVVATRNFSWRNAGGAYKNWKPQEPFIEVNPMFVDPARGDFRLQAGSPAIAAGAGVVDRGVRSYYAVAGELESPSKAAGPVPVGPSAAKGGRKLALVVGVQHYQDPAIKDLKYARSDAESVARYLRKAGYTVNLLTEAAASVTAVKAALINLTRAAPGDSVLIYLSVHGSGEPNPLGAGHGFLLLSDAQTSSIPSTSLAVQEIQTAVDRTASERVVLILDSCFSGGASAQAKSIWTTRNIKGDGESITGSIVYGRGKIGLFSSRDNEVSLEADEFKHGYFTYYLLEAWGRGLRSVDEVYAYVQREVANSTKGQQHPRYSSAQAEGQAPTF